MRKYIKIFLVTALILFFINFSCSEENTNNQDPYGEAELISYFSSDSCRITWGDSTYHPDSAEVEIVVDSFDINITHENAILNSCPDSIEVILFQHENILILYETDNGGMCYGDCPFEITAIIRVAEADSYLITIVTKDRGTVYEESVEVP